MGSYLLKKSFVVLCLFICVFSSFAQESELEVVFLDVGKGDAIYLETPDRGKILIDSGNLITGFRVVEFLKRKNVEKLDALIITHPHPDHMGGIFHVLQQIKVLNCYDNGQTFENSRNKELYNWYTDLFRQGSYQSLSAGSKLKFGEIIIDVLSPSRLTTDWNANSLVLKVSYGKTSFLLMGDANLSVEKDLLGRGVKLNSDVLKVGHHGAQDASTQNFISMVSPRFAVISVDKNNINGYPDKNLISRFANSNVELLTTAQYGNIIFSSNGKQALLTK